MPEGWGIEDNSGRIPRHRMADTRGGPPYGGGCWAEKRLHDGSAHSRYSGAFTPCTKGKRTGKLTCHWHDMHEEAAQALLAEKNTKKESE